MDRGPLRLGVVRTEFVLARVDEIGLLDHTTSEERFDHGEGLGRLHNRFPKNQPSVVHRLLRLVARLLESHDSAEELRVGPANDCIPKAYAGILRLTRLV